MAQTLLERNVEGYLGTTVIVHRGNSSISNIRYIIHRFTDKISIEKWEKSQESVKMLEEVNKYSIRQYDISTGLETWFNFPDVNTISSPPPKWKMAIVVFIAAYTISLSSQSILRPIIGQQQQLPLAITNLIYVSIMVISLPFFAMSIMSRLLKRWPYSNPKILQQS